MDKIIGLGNALVDVLATLDSDEILAEMELPKGSMTLIGEDSFGDRWLCGECHSRYGAAWSGYRIYRKGK